MFGPIDQMKDFLIKSKKSIVSCLFFLVPIIVFVLYKLFNLTLRFSDSNAYFYMADQILKGSLPYRDFPLADPPLLVYLLTGFKFLFAQNLILFQTLPVACEVFTALILFLKLKKAGNRFAPLVSFIHLFSFLILATSDYLTGLHFVILFLSWAWYFEDRPVLSGIFWSLATLIKLYTIPAFLAYALSLILNKEWQKLKKFILAFGLTALIIMLPFLITSFKEVLDYTLIHQLSRPGGLDKAYVFKFFMVHDFAYLAVVLGAGFLAIKQKNKANRYRLVLPILALLLFFIIFADLYYLYLGVFSPFFVLLILEQLEKFWQKSKALQKQLIKAGLIFYCLVSLVFFAEYHRVYQKQNQFVQFEQVLAFVTANLDPAYPIYGSHEVAPLIALASHRNLFANLIDTNAQLFASGALDKETVSQAAATQGVYLFSKVANLSYNANPDAGYEGYFSEKVFQQSCQKITIINGNDVDIFDDIAIYKCKTAQ